MSEIMFHQFTHVRTVPFNGVTMVGVTDFEVPMAPSKFLI